MNAEARRILLVDDDTDLLRLLSMRLSAAGYAVTQVESAEQAMARFPVLRPDLVVTDLRMAGMDGLGLFEEIRQVNASVPVIILTAHGSIAEAVAATRRGVFSFLTKPVDSRALLEEVRKALNLSGAKPGALPAGKEAAWRQEIITRSPLMEDLLGRLKLVAESDSSVLLLGESGTGKELLARAIHQAGPRVAGPFVAVNCGSIPEALLESELFGHTKGAFTGATQDYAGLFKSANGGTLLLDEIGDMPLALQVKLLRVIQEKQVRSVGSTRVEPVDVRIVSATHRDLEAAVADGRFRQDLYYRLNVVCLEVPNLARRREDIPLLAEHFRKTLAARSGKKLTGFAPEAMELLLNAAWPGNIRQLLNVVEQAVALATTPVISADLLQVALRESPEKIPSLAEARRKFEQDYLVRLMQMTRGNVSQAARIADRNRTDFYKLLQRHHIVPQLFKAE
ncbi:sigma 54-interacting transcriptional regulator [Trichloromonas sp.]|uniref:sigma 54-interacting transcriptional regulator n=1 Tax=Trichloromonas sp. TaxID=3069249 RepID=UPI002A3B4212|nr:sigma 54-interacting transcriptional regulator [Trichloromonas sp.]